MQQLYFLRTAINEIDRLGAESATTSTDVVTCSSQAQPSTSGVNTINNVSLNESIQNRAQDNFRQDMYYGASEYLLSNSLF